MIKKTDILFLQIYGGGGIMGGTETYLKNLLNEVAKKDKKSKFHVAAFNKKRSVFSAHAKVTDSFFTRFLENWSVNNVLYRYRYIGMAASVWGLIFLYITASRVVRENNIRLIYANGGLLTTLLGYLLHRRFGLPYVLHIHGLFNFKKLLLGKKIPLSLRVLRGVTRDAFTHASCVIANSREVADDINSAMGWGKRAKIVHCFTDSEYFFPRSKAAARKKLVFPQNKFIFFSPNRLSLDKGMDILIQAIRAYKDHNISFIFAGDGDLRKDVEQLAKEHADVTYIGPLSQSVLPDYYNAADIVWSTASVYYLALTHIEALACGTCIVGLNKPFPADNDFGKMVQSTTIPKEVGFIVKDDVQSLVKFFKQVVKRDLSSGRAERVKFYNKEYGKDNIEKVKEILYTDWRASKSS